VLLLLVRQVLLLLLLVLLLRMVLRLLPGRSVRKRSNHSDCQILAKSAADREDACLRTGKGSSLADAYQPAEKQLCSIDRVFAATYKLHAVSELTCDTQCCTCCTAVWLVHSLPVADPVSAA
jgi:hypothetical protein